MIYHNSQDLECRSPFGAAEASSEVSITVTADYASGAVLRTWTDEQGEYKYEMQKDGDNFSATIKMPDFGTLLWYYFIIYYPSGDSCLYGAPADNLGGIGQEYRDNPKSFQITVYKPTTTPSWFKDGIMYQIFPDRFNKGSDFKRRQKTAQRHIVEDWYEVPSYIKDDEGNVIDWTFYGGTLKGIEEKIQYLKSLGIKTLYLNPIFKAKSNHRYDTCDYTKIDELLGDEKSFVSLCKAANKAGIHIIFDGVYSHAGKDSIYFQKDSEYRNWFKIKEDGSYDCWWGVKDLPEIDETYPSYVEYICGKHGVINKWLSLGASGIRLDVADELPDSFIKNVRKIAKDTKEDSVILGEVWEDASNKFSHGEKRKYLMGEELDSTMNYPLRNILIDFALSKDDAFLSMRKILSLMENYPKEIFYSCMNMLSSHDRERILTVLDSDKEMLKMLYSLLFFLPGVPCIYYGDETGMEGEADPYNRACYPWGKEDKSLIKYFGDLTSFYHRHEVLKNGDFTPLYLNNNVLSFIRKNDKEKLLILANRLTEDLNIYFEGKEYEVTALSTICAPI